MAFDQGYADALAENETLRQDVADAEAKGYQRAIDELLKVPSHETHVAADWLEAQRGGREPTFPHTNCAELDDANKRITNLSAQCNRNTEQLGRLQREAAERDADLRSTQQMVVRADRALAATEAERDDWKAGCERALRDREAVEAEMDRRLIEAWTERDDWREVVETAKAVRELWRYDAMAAAEPEIHAFVAAVDALSTKDANHRYLSTACLHAVEPGHEHLHRECQSDTTRHDGTHKIGASCKWCEAPCVCRCHVSTKDGA